MDIIEHNREAWNQQVEEENIWTRPVDSKTIEDAKKGNWSVLLTPIKPVPLGWFPELKGRKVLCLASGGGQQGPVFAAVGADVTVFDNSPSQLKRDIMVAERDGLSIKIEQGDMRDLSRFANESFDMIFHPVSNCFMDDVNKVWKECYRVLKKGGTLLAGFCNPITYIFDFNEWDENQKLIVRYSIPYSDLEQLPKEQLEAKITNKTSLEFGHSLQDQIGGQINAGFMISGFYEDSSGGDLLDPYINTFIATRAIK
ncbi:MAG: methyltransferase domain-containing protein [Clostridiaceae bacterium]|jgi:SAM-dependent methyltransferase|nr:methyltransferase domain-containing protein [Clostridiaceae bacterium]